MSSSTHPRSQRRSNQRSPRQRLTTAKRTEAPPRKQPDVRSPYQSSWSSASLVLTYPSNQKRTWAIAAARSALPLKADIRQTGWNEAALLISKHASELLFQTGVLLLKGFDCAFERQHLRRLGMIRRRAGRRDLLLINHHEGSSLREGKSRRRRLFRFIRGTVMPDQCLKVHPVPRTKG